jgi:hypothetical protein
MEKIPYHLQISTKNVKKLCFVFVKRTMNAICVKKGRRWNFRAS